MSRCRSPRAVPILPTSCRALPSLAPRRSLRPRPYRGLPLLIGSLLLASALACGDGGSAPATEEPAESTTGESALPETPAEVEAPESPAAPSTPASDLPVVAFLGDSLTAGYGLGEAQAFPARLEEQLQAEGLPFRAVNAGVSGDTSAGGLARLDWVLSTGPDVVVVELGPNDGLRGLDLAMTETNLRAIVRRASEAGARVLLVGMRIPPNYGPDYAGRFEELYPRLAEELDVPLVPFLLADVGGVPELNQGDGIHPTAEGQEIVAANVAPHLEPLLAAEWEERGGVPEDLAAAAGAAGEAARRHR
jgi:acyl-CoA thioesterase I